MTTTSTETFDEILQRLQAKAVSYTDQWTDFNESDPGVVLLQLFAHTMEQLEHRIGQIPQRSTEQFLRLLDLPRNPARPAEAHVAFSVENAGAGPIPAGFRFTGTPPGGDALVFETQSDLDLIRAGKLRLFRKEAGMFQEVTPPEPGTLPAAPFQPFGEGARPELYLAFAGLPAATPPVFPRKFSLQVLLAPGNRLRRVIAADDPGKIARLVPPVQLVWEYQRREGDWRPLSVFEDTSVAMLQNGYLHIQGPEDIELVEDKSVAQAKGKFYWLRCRVEDGAYERRPELERILPNAVMTLQVQTVREEVLGASRGVPDQVFALRRKPVWAPDGDEDPIELRLEGESEPWKRVFSFVGVGRDERVYWLDRNEGTVKFGDGDNGLIPPAGKRLIARRYRAGGGAAGNLPPQSLAPAGSLPGVKAMQVRAASGGANEQSLDDLARLAPQVLASQSRLVTASDYEQAARRFGGVAQAAVLENWIPHFPDAVVPGALTVLIVPTGDAPRRDPSPELLQAIAGEFAAKRMIGAEVFVAGPTYVEVEVFARIEAAPYESFDTIAENAVREIQTFFRGRRIGGDLRRSQLLQRVANVAGVSSVELELSEQGTPMEDPRRVAKHELLYVTRPIVRVVPERDE